MIRILRTTVLSLIFLLSYICLTILHTVKQWLFSLFGYDVNSRVYRANDGTGVTFSGKSEAGTKIILAAVGELLLDNGVQQCVQQRVNEAISDPDQAIAEGYNYLFQNIKDEIKLSDFAVANLESPIARNLTRRSAHAPGGRFISAEKVIDPYLAFHPEVYSTSTPVTFNGHPALAFALKESGLDMIFTANNHVTDRLSNGIDQTIEALRKARLETCGAFLFDELKDDDADGMPDNTPYVIKEIKGIRIAFFAYTHLVNPHFYDFRRSDPYSQVCKFSDHYLTNKYLPNIKKWILYSRQVDKVDLVVFSSHCGFEMNHYISQKQYNLAHELLEAGVDVILGGHPHAILPFEKYITEDKRETFVIYSMGNFLTSWFGVNYRTGVILYLGIVKSEKGCFITGMKYLPVFTRVKKGAGKSVDVQIFPVDESGEFKKAFRLATSILGYENCKKPGEPVVF